MAAHLLPKQTVPAADIDLGIARGHVGPGKEGAALVADGQRRHGGLAVCPAYAAARGRACGRLLPACERALLRQREVAAQPTQFDVVEVEIAVEVAVGLHPKFDLHGLSAEGAQVEGALCPTGRDAAAAERKGRRRELFIDIERRVVVIAARVSVAGCFGGRGEVVEAQPHGIVGGQLDGLAEAVVQVEAPAHPRQVAGRGRGRQAGRCVERVGGVYQRIGRAVFDPCPPHLAAKIKGAVGDNRHKGDLAGRKGLFVKDQRQQHRGVGERRRGPNCRRRALHFRFEGWLRRLLRKRGRVPECGYAQHNEAERQGRPPTESNRRS